MNIPEPKPSRPVQPTYLISIEWSGAVAAGPHQYERRTGTVEVENFKPLWDGQPSVFRREHLPVVKQTVMDKLADVNVAVGLDNMSIVSVWRWEE